MALIADMLLVAGALGAGLYCFVLSRRLSRFNDLERGVGGAVAVLSAQVDDMTKALERARAAAGSSAETLETTTARAEGVAQRLELLLAAMHDLPDGTTVRAPPAAATPPERVPESTPAKRVVWRRPRSERHESEAGSDDELPVPAFRRTVGPALEAAE